MKISIPAVFLLLALAGVPSSARALGPPKPSRAEAVAATGLGVNLPLVARLIGAGPTLYITTVDVQNNTATATQVDWYLNGVNLRTSTALALVGSVSSTG